VKADPRPACTDCVHDVDDHAETWNTKDEYGPGCLIPRCPCVLNQQELTDTE